MIVIDDLCVTYGKKRVIDHLSLQIKKGESVFLAGANGAGKTTLLRAIAGIIRTRHGTVSTRHQKVAYIPASLSFYESVKIEEAIRLFYSIHKPFTYRQIGGYKFDEKRRIHSLSKGERTLFLLSLALSISPDFLLIDDIIHFLDPHLREIFMQTILSLLEEERLGLVIAAQSCLDIEGILERLVVLDRGKKVMDEAVDDLKRSFVKVYADQEPSGSPVVFKREWNDVNEYYLYPYHPSEKPANDIQYLALPEILRALIGGEYDVA